MKRMYLSVNIRYTCTILLLLLVASCDAPKPSDAAVQHSDSSSVKKMDPGNNSEMPVGASKDSTTEIPNAYKPEEKAQ